MDYTKNTTTRSSILLFHQSCIIIVLFTRHFHAMINVGPFLWFGNLQGYLKTDVQKCLVKMNEMDELAHVL